jgi:hypothetical protein
VTFVAFSDFELNSDELMLTLPAKSIVVLESERSNHGSTKNWPTTDTVKGSNLLTTEAVEKGIV